MWDRRRYWFSEEWGITGHSSLLELLRQTVSIFKLKETIELRIDIKVSAFIYLILRGKPKELVRFINKKRHFSEFILGSNICTFGNNVVRWLMIAPHSLSLVYFSLANIFCRKRIYLLLSFVSCCSLSPTHPYCGNNNHLYINIFVQTQSDITVCHSEL